MVCASSSTSITSSRLSFEKKIPEQCLVCSEIHVLMIQHLHKDQYHFSLPFFYQGSRNLNRNPGTRHLVQSV